MHLQTIQTPKNGKGKEPGKKGAGGKVLADLTSQPAGTKRQKRACTLKQAAAATCDR